MVHLHGQLIGVYNLLALCGYCTGVAGGEGLDHELTEGIVRTVIKILARAKRDGFKKARSGYKKR